MIGLWDLFAIAIAALGLFLADNGSTWIGAILYGLVVMGFPIALLHNRRLPVALPLTFAARYVIGSASSSEERWWAMHDRRQACS